MNKEPLFSEELRNILTEMQYGTVTLEEILPVINDSLSLTLTANEVSLYDSSQLEIGATSGFDAIAIHVQVKDMDQVYYIVRGTEDAPDVYYDATGIAANATQSQLYDAETFFREVNETIQNAGAFPENFGDGHSLGGNIITNLALKVNTNEKEFSGSSFSHVRGLNDAPANIYGLLDFDNGFYLYVQREHGIKEPKRLSPTILFSYAKTYYKDPARIIEHYRVKGEPLYAQEFHGSIYMGDRIHYLGDMETEDFTNIGTYPLSHLSWVPLFKLEELRYNAGVNWLLKGMREFENDIGFEKAMELQESPLGRFILGSRLTKDAILYGGPLLIQPGFHHHVRQGILQRHQLEYHSIAHLSAPYGSSPTTTFYNVLDPLSGLPIILNQEDLQHFLTRCQQVVDEKEQIIQELHAYASSHLLDSYQQAQYDLLVEMERWERQPEKFSSIKKKGNGYGILGGLDGVRQPATLTFDTYFPPISSGVLGPVDEIRHLIQQEKDQLQQFISDMVATMDTLLEKDAFLAAKMKTHPVGQGGVRLQ